MRFTVSMAAICAAWALAASGAAAGTLEVLVLDRDGKPTPDAVVIVIPSGKQLLGLRVAQGLGRRAGLGLDGGRGQAQGQQRRRSM